LLVGLFVIIRRPCNFSRTAQLHSYSYKMEVRLTRTAVKSHSDRLWIFVESSDDG